jgi:hypothetical protein
MDLGHGDPIALAAMENDSAKAASVVALRKKNVRRGMEFSLAASLEFFSSAHHLSIYFN